MDALMNLAVNEAVGYALILVGVAFDLFGCIGLVRMPTLYNRMQAATKAVTLGTISLLIGTAMVMGIVPISAKALLCALFVLLTSPTATHALARAAHRAGIPLDKHAVCDHYAADQKHEAKRQGDS